MRQLPKRVLAPENGKSGLPRLVVPDDKYEAIDWSVKSDVEVTISYPNRLKNQCCMGPCKVCVCNS